jgi:hypothetical protein
LQKPGMIQSRKKRMVKPMKHYLSAAGIEIKKILRYEQLH